MSLGREPAEASQARIPGKADLELACDADVNSATEKQGGKPYSAGITLKEAMVSGLSGPQEKIDPRTIQSN